MKKLILASVVSIFFLGFTIARASLVISEIMYDLPDSDEGKEWVEVFNSGPESVDLSLYKFFEGDTNHKIIGVHGSPKVEANSYAILVSSPEKFKASYSTFSGNVFDSSFSLGNDGETLALKDKDLKVVDEVSYKSNIGGAGNGRTVSLIGGVWREGKATMGAVNQLYVLPAKPIVKDVPVTKPTPTPKGIGVPTENVGKEETKIEEVPVVENNTQTASVVDGTQIPISENKKSPAYLISLFGLVALGAGTVYLVRRKKTPTEELEGDDFEIMEE